MGEIVVLYRPEDQKTVEQAAKDEGKSYKQAQHNWESVVLRTNNLKKDLIHPDLDTIGKLQEFHAEQIIGVLVRTGIPEGRLWKGDGDAMEQISVSKLSFKDNLISEEMN